MKNGKYLLFLFLFIPFLPGCSVVPLGLSYSSTPLEGSGNNHRQYEVVGRAEGSQGYFTLFGLFPFGSPDLTAATDDAKSKLNGDALINVRYWYRVSNYLVGTYSTIEIEGDVIKFKQGDK